MIPAALLALALAAATAQPLPGARSPTPIQIVESGTTEYDLSGGNVRVRATGGVTLRRGAVTLHAEEATWDDATGVVEATGGVLLTEPGRAVSANRMHAVLDGPFQAHDIVAFLKDAPLDLSRCRTSDEARDSGRNRLVFHGDRAAGETRSQTLEVDGARVTLCDCGAGPPPWEIRARHAAVIPGKRALLSWPVFYVTPRFLFVHTPVPVLVLPVAYLPLSERQSGLLLPEVTAGGNSGWGVDLPLFLTLGRSYDATLTTAYVFGPTEATVASQHRGVKGPGETLELRWAPSEGTRGQARVFALHSLIPDWPGGAAGPPGDNRIALSLAHDQRVSDRTMLELQLGLIGDPYYLADFTGDPLLRAADYRRSGVALTHRRDDLVLEADAAYHLPLTGLDACLGAGACPVRAPFGVFGADVPVFHRLPSASAMLLPTRVAGPLRLGIMLGIARFAPIRGATGDEGANGVGPGERGWSYLADPGERDGRWEAGERLATTRGAARVELTAPFSLAGALQVEPWAAGTATAYAFDAGPGAQGDARAAAGLSVSAPFGRSFGSGASRFRHVVEPAIAWRGGTGQAGPGLPAFAYDELDVALPPPRVGASATGAAAVLPQRALSAIPGSFSQVRLSLRNRLVAGAGTLSNGFLDVTVGQDLDAAAGRASETWMAAGLHLVGLSADASARFRAFGARLPELTPRTAPPARLDAFTELRASVTASDRRGDDLHGTFIAVGPGGSPRLEAGLEPFFDPRAFAVDAVAQGGVGARVRVSGATLGYDAAFNARELTAPLCPGKSTGPHVYQHAASLVWDSPCRCWKAGVTASLFECDAHPRFGFIIDLSSLTERRSAAGP